MMGKFMLFKSFCWKKGAREAKRFIPVQQEPGGGGGQRCQLVSRFQKGDIGPSQVDQEVRLDFKARG